MMLKRLVLILILLVVNCSFGQLTTSNSQSPGSLVQNVLLGQGVTVSNIQYNGSNVSIGSFTANNTNLGISSGIIMTTGTILDNGKGPQGPNNNENVSFDTKTSGFQLLTDLTNGAKTLNAAYLQMDIVPQSDTVRFKYVFGSEEYPKFAPPNSSDYNDVFGFFISGPGIVGQQNIAKLPNGTTVSINNINAVTNNNYFVYNGDGNESPYNSSSNYIQYNGFTKVLEAVARVQCGETYHLILAIADVQDGLYDSGIFLEANSLKAKVDFDVTSEISYDAYNDKSILAEGCAKQTIKITRQGNYLPPLSVPIVVTGTATQGVDYSSTIPDTLKLAKDQTSFTFEIDAFSDNLTEGLETIILNFLFKGACLKTKQIEKIFSIKDPKTLTAQVTTGIPVCPGDKVEVMATITDGVGPFEYLWNPTNEITSSIFVTPLVPTNYSVTIKDNCLGNIVQASAIVQVPIPDPLIINKTPDFAEMCPYITKRLESNVSGGIAPYHYLWTSSGPIPIGTNEIFEVTPSKTTTYTIKVKDFCGQTAKENIVYTVVSPPLTLQMAPNVEICPGDSVLVWCKPSGGHPVPAWSYNYKWKGKTIADSSFWVNPYFTTTYSVSVSDSCQTFTVEDSITITVVKPTADFEIDSKTLFNNLSIKFQNTTQHGDHYTWNFGDGHTSNMTHPNNTFIDPGQYDVHLIAYDKKGCMDSITKPIVIEEEYYLYIPNSFTPEGGRLNEKFEASTYGIKSLSIIICNRWGEIVFSSDDLNFRWDGMYNNMPAQNGTYTYKVAYTTNSNKNIELVGSVTIVR